MMTKMITTKTNLRWHVQAIVSCLFAFGFGTLAHADIGPNPARRPVPEPLPQPITDLDPVQPKPVLPAPVDVNPLDLSPAENKAIDSAPVIKTPDDLKAAIDNARAVPDNATANIVTWDIRVGSPDNDSGANLDIRFSRASKTGKPDLSTPVLVLRRAARASDTKASELSVNTDGSPILSAAFLFSDENDPKRRDVDTNDTAMEPGAKFGDWTVVGIIDPDDKGIGSASDSPGVDSRVVYALLPTHRAALPNTLTGFPGAGVQTSPRATEGAFFNWTRWFLLALVIAVGASFGIYVLIAKRPGTTLFVRRISGVDAIEDAIGRSTEMGRPVLYVTGVDEIQDIQTIASLLILGHVAEMTATYDTEIKVANAYPMTMIVAEEIVRQGYANAGRPDAHVADNVMFITSEQFAFAAAVNGMILRDRPAANIYLGRFYAESLILAETGFLTGAVQIAGTAEFTQLPFFIAACDHTLIGEELYATSAYLSRDPVQLAQLKAGDVMKVIIAVLVLTGVVLGTFWHFDMMKVLLP